MKKILLVLFVVINISLNAQNNSTFKHKIGVYVGSSFVGMNTNMWIKDGNRVVKDAYATPVPMLSYTYMATDKIGFGVAGSYQLFNFDLLPLDASLSAIVMKINRYNVNLHAKYYFLNNQTFDIYAGGRIGGTFWYGNVSFDELFNYLEHITPDFIPSSLINKIVPSNLPFTKISLAGQLNFGVDYYFIDNVGIKAEMAVGAPYWVLTGLNIRL
jgi:outer membrane protein W